MFKITIENGTGQKIEEKEFNEKKEANKFKKELIKKYNLIKHAGHIVNYSDQIELWTNY
jgi:hypothetical protein